MKPFIKMTVRNLRVFFRDKMAVFFSFLSVIIIIGLYALFLANVQVSAIQNIVGKGVTGVRFMVDSWIMAGLLAVQSVTVTLGALAVLINDRQKKLSADFLVAPLKRSTLLASYVASSFIIGLVVSLVGLFAMEGYILLSGGQMLSVFALLKVIGVMVLNLLLGTFMMFFFVSFIKTIGAYSTMSTIVGTAIGFLTGIYIPSGVLPEAAQSIIKLVPISHAAALFRQIFMAEPLAQTFAGAPAQALAHYRLEYGVDFMLADKLMEPWMFLAYIAGATVVFALLSLWRASKIKL